MEQFMAEEDVSNDSIISIFEQAAYDVQCDDDGDLIIDDEIHRTLVRLDEGTRTIKFLALFGAEEEMDMDLKRAHVNRMNDDHKICKFSIREDDPTTFVVEYEMPYRFGIIPLQLIKMYRRFWNHTLVAIGEHSRMMA